MGGVGGGRRHREGSEERSAGGEEGEDEAQQAQVGAELPQAAGERHVLQRGLRQVRRREREPGVEAAAAAAAADAGRRRRRRPTQAVLHAVVDRDRLRLTCMLVVVEVVVVKSPLHCNWIVEHLTCLGVQAVHVCLMRVCLCVCGCV